MIASDCCPTVFYHFQFLNITNYKMIKILYIVTKYGGFVI